MEESIQEESKKIDQDTETMESEEKISLKDILKTENLCEILDEDDLTEISQQVFSRSIHSLDRFYGDNVLFSTVNQFFHNLALVI